MKPDFVKRNWKKLLPAAILLTVALLTFAWLGATYIPWREKRWKENGTLYVIGMNYWYTPLETWVIFDEGGSLHGPMSDSGKWHGKWTELNSDGLTYHWYWYGEEVTEGLRGDGTS